MSKMYRMCYVCMCYIYTRFKIHNLSPDSKNLCVKTTCLKKIAQGGVYHQQDPYNTFDALKA